MYSGTNNSWIEFDVNFIVTKVLSKDNRLRLCGYHYGDKLPDNVVDFIKNSKGFYGYKSHGMQIEIIRPYINQLGFSICISDDIAFIESKLDCISAINEKLMLCQTKNELIKESVKICLNDLDIDRAGFFLFDHEKSTMQGTWGTDESGELYEDYDLVLPLSGQDVILEMLENHEFIRIRKNIDLVTSGRIGGNGWHIAILLWSNDGAFGWLSCDNYINQNRLYSMQKNLMEIFSKSLSQWFSVIENNEKLQNLSSELRKVLGEKSENLQNSLMELSMMHKKVYSYEKINLLSKFTSGLAHEINNPNSFVMANVSYLLKQEPLIKSVNNLALPVEFQKPMQILQEDWTDILVDSQEGLMRIKNIINALEPINYCMSEEICDIYIISVLNFIKEKFDKSLVINLNIPKDSLFRIKSKKVVVETVLNNVLKNSSEAYEKNKSNFDDRIVDIKIIDEHGEVKILVRDYATGIKKEDINKVFDPFSTDKDEHASVGLGLSVAQQLLLSVDGDIYANLCSVGVEIIINLPARI